MTGIITSAEDPKTGYTFISVQYLEHPHKNKTKGCFKKTLIVHVDDLDYAILHFGEEIQFYGVEDNDGNQYAKLILNTPTPVYGRSPSEEKFCNRARRLFTFIFWTALIVFVPYIVGTYTPFLPDLRVSGDAALAWLIGFIYILIMGIILGSLYLIGYWIVTGESLIILESPN